MLSVLEACVSIVRLLLPMGPNFYKFENLFFGLLIFIFSQNVKLVGDILYHTSTNINSRKFIFRLQLISAHTPKVCMLLGGLPSFNRSMVQYLIMLR